MFLKESKTVCPIPAYVIEATGETTMPQIYLVKNYFSPSEPVRYITICIGEFGETIVTYATTFSLGPKRLTHLKTKR